MTEVPKPPFITHSPMFRAISSYRSMRPLSRSIWVLAVSAPPGMGDSGMSGSTARASGGTK